MLYIGGMTPTAARNLSNRLALGEPDRALSIARGIENPWFKCQALSQVARYWPNEQYSALLTEAVHAADLQEETYQQVAVSAWPIRAFLERNNPVPAAALITKYTARSSSIANMGSRSEALLLVFQAARPFDRDHWLPAFRALIKAAEPSLSWRQGRAVRYAAEMVISDDRSLVTWAVHKLSNEKNVAALRTLLGNAEAQQAPPRPFFWIESNSN